ncbi:hypothetical protein [Amycolatopsis sp. WGS_07]|uniref:hypothetical protein n=1 Tax=Amycolatopsis sp. WGS_07 TaxID=3076764 RepID=UPI0038730CD0
MTGMATPRGLAPSASVGASTSPPATSALLGMVDRAKPKSRTRAGARRRPRAWAAPIARPAARIAVAGGLTLAGWLLGAALSQANAATDDQVDRPTASAHDPEPEHRYAGTATSGTLTWAMPGSATRAKHAHRFQFSASDFRPEVSFRPGTLSGSDSTDSRPKPAVSPPTAKTAKAPEPVKHAKPKSKAKHHAPVRDPEATSSSEPQHGLLDGLLGGSDRDSGQGLLGGLLGGPETDQPGLLDGILGTVDDTVDTTLHTTVTSVDTVIDTAPVRVVVPPSATVEPAPVASGSVSVSAPPAKLVKEPAAPVAVKVSKQAPVVHPVPARVLTGQPAPAHETQPAPPVKQRSQAGGGGSGGGEGLPSAPAAPAAPASTVSPGHDGSGGLRQLFALASDGVTATQLKLIGVSRDHEVAGAGRDAALPTTSPD